eukprot:Protomagalhaensia_sp_Gyna_25__2507@NODE_240_length_4219_cov_173_176077_g186_i0_p2_GENE_NODE_240_length_4219_cov_173_176077_g186_i0NODE_240_length_4219_cov_173_176077_g186_i0_p2_ORF_typecomplete_len311_score34_34_NODE_240_length_4219_cov_173_176077_g186_i031684100
MNSDYYCLPEEFDSGMHIYWAATPSLLTDPFEHSDNYFAHESMRFLEDFEYPSWPEFDRRLKSYEQHEKSDICSSNYHPRIDAYPAIMPRDVTEGGYLEPSMRIQTAQLQQLDTGNYMASRPVSPALRTSTRFESRSPSPIMRPNRTGARAKQYEGVPVTLDTIVAAFRGLSQPFTFKRVMYMDWVKPHLLAYPPVRNGGTIESVLLLLPAILNSQEQESIERDNPLNESEVEILLTSIANKLMLLHFFAHGTYHCNSQARNKMVTRLGQLIYGSDVNTHDARFLHVRKVLENRVKHFRDVMARQFKVIQ